MPLSDALQPLHAFFMVVSFVFGCVVGSFCNVCISRWPEGLSVVSPRSRCPVCKNGIAWYDNFPLVSWLLLGAKCRHCQTPISWQYPLVEALTGVLFMLVFLRFGFVAATPVYMAFGAAMIIVVFQDLTDWTIPNEVTIPGMFLGLGLALLGMVYAESALRVTNPLHALDGIVLGAFVICFLDSAVVLLLKKPGMGFGDVKLLAMLGAFLGWQGVLGTLMLASMLGSVVGMSLILYFKARTGAPDSEEEDESQLANEPYPVDPLANVVLGAGGVYLLFRLMMYIQTLPPIALGIPRSVLMLGPAILALFSVGIAAASLYVHSRQKASGKYAAHDVPAPKAGAPEEADDALESEEEITLSNHYLPFGPYLAVGGLLFLFYGPELIRAYMASLRP